MEIEKGIPIPPRSGRVASPEGERIVRVLEEMDVGDSVLVPEGEASMRFRNVATYRGYRVAQRQGDEAGTNRFWLLAKPFKL